MVKEAVLHELCAVACEALHALKYRGLAPKTQEELQTRFHLVLEELGPTWWLNFAEME
tara:strand:+ start:343 stop:516 length:174 start_codon:yes stop_codon:yes gene_type:complete